MNINCAICSDQLTPTSDIYTTSCGHVFHYPCLIKWTEKARTCPQCRNKATEDTIHRIYFNLTNTDGIVDNADTLHFKLNNYKSVLKLKEKDIQIYREKYNNEMERTSKLKSMLNDLENEREVSDSAEQALKRQLIYYKVKSEDCDFLCEEISSLKDRLKKFDNVMSVLTYSKEQANEMLRHNRNSDSLNILVSTLKKELVEANRKSKQAAANLKDTNDSLSCYKKELLDLKKENDKHKFDAEAHKNCAKQQQFLKKKLFNLEMKLPSVKTSPNEEIIFSEDDCSSEKHPISKDLSIINFTKTLSPSVGKHMKLVELPDSDLKSLGRNDKNSFLDLVEPQVELKRCKLSSAVSKVKFRKLAPNKRLQDYLLNDDK